MIFWGPFVMTKHTHTHTYLPVGVTGHKHRISTLSSVKTRNLLQINDILTHDSFHFRDMLFFCDRFASMTMIYRLHEKFAPLPLQHTHTHHQSALGRAIHIIVVVVVRSHHHRRYDDADWKLRMEANHFDLIEMNFF